MRLLKMYGNCITTSYESAENVLLYVQNVELKLFLLQHTITEISKFLWL